MRALLRRIIRIAVRADRAGIKVVSARLAGRKNGFTSIAMPRCGQSNLILLNVRAVFAAYLGDYSVLGAGCFSPLSAVKLVTERRYRFSLRERT